jgi:hypothetical protein
LTFDRSSLTTVQTGFLISEVSRLTRELAAARLVSANRLAAIRAALSAAGDGETDPLAYLRDQLDEEAAAGSRGRC